MFNLDDLYQGHKPLGDNPLCEGCTILEQSKPCHSVMDYESLEECNVLFLSDSVRPHTRHSPFPVTSFGKAELRLLKESYPEKFVTAASVKCPSVKEGDMTPNNMNLCRQHLEATIDKVKPKLIFTCGNLPMKMLLKKSGITTKRGKSFEYSTEAGHQCIVVPIFHPWACIKEPRHLALFKKDIQNAYEKYILCKDSSGDFKYKVLMSFDEVEALHKQLKDSEDTLAVDTETTGLNFLEDEIMTISITSKENTWVIPLDHKDSPFKDQPKVWILLRDILQNPKNKKVFHKAKFDLKFLINYGIYTKNVWDTKIMHHLLDENMPKGLMDLTKLYFANELENL